MTNNEKNLNQPILKQFDHAFFLFLFISRIKKKNIIKVLVTQVISGLKHLKLTHVLHSNLTELGEFNPEKNMKLFTIIGYQCFSLLSYQAKYFNLY